jgi:hypothetical protein
MRRAVPAVSWPRRALVITGAKPRRRRGSRHCPARRARSRSAPSHPCGRARLVPDRDLCIRDGRARVARDDKAKQARRRVDLVPQHEHARLARLQRRNVHSDQPDIPFGRAGSEAQLDPGRDQQLDATRLARVRRITECRPCVECLNPHSVEGSSVRQRTAMHDQVRAGRGIARAERSRRPVLRREVGRQPRGGFSLALGGIRIGRCCELVPLRERSPRSEPVDRRATRRRAAPARHMRGSGACGTSRAAVS